MRDFICRLLEGHSDETLMREIVTSEGAQAADFMLEDLQGCKIKLIGSLSAIRMRNISKCTIVAGPIQGSAFLEGKILIKEVQDVNFDWN